MWISTFQVSIPNEEPTCFLIPLEEPLSWDSIAERRSLPNKYWLKMEIWKPTAKVSVLREILNGERWMPLVMPLLPL